MENMTVMSGTEAIVRGAIEYGVRIISGYPGYPITGIMENAKKAGLEDLHIEWAPNEKVALETVLGTSVVGLKVAAITHECPWDKMAQSFFWLKDPPLTLRDSIYRNQHK